MNKKLLSILASALLAVLLVFGALAEETQTVYATGSLVEAVEKLGGAGGTVVLANDITVSGDITVPEQSGNLTITSENGAKLIVSGSLIFEKNTNDNVITLDVPVAASDAVIYGGFNSVTFTENFTVNGTLDFYGGLYNVESDNGATTSRARYYYAQNQLITAELPYDITVNGGTFRNFMGGNYRLGYSSLLGSIAAPITVTINGGTFGTGVSYDADTALKIDKAFSISGMSILADDATLTINGGTFNTPIYAQGYIGQTSTRTSGCSQYTNSDKKFYAIDGDIAININGGKLNGFEVGATQITAAYQQLVRGNYTVTVTDAATYASDIIFDATQVKAYDGSDAKATLVYPESDTVKVVRFDVVNDETKTYDEPLRIACVGDSITQGSRAVIDGVENFELGSYPAQLYKKMFDLGEDVIVANYGCGATKVMDYSGLHYNAGLAYTLSMEETDPDYVIVGLGTNDAASTTYTYGMGERFYEEYTALILGYEALASTEMVYGTSAIYRVSTDVAAVSNIRGLQETALTTQAAAGKACTYIDLYALLLDEALAGTLLSGDNLHPDVEGYGYYADAIYDAVRNGVTKVENFEMTDLYVSASGTNNAECTQGNPTSNLAIAFAKAADEATIHIIGTYDYAKIGNANWGFSTPTNVKKLTIKGEGEGATLNLNGKHLFIKSDAVFDNIAVYTTAGGALHFACGYHNVEFTETFTCKDALMAAGVVALGEDKSSGWYNSREAVSFENDCTITVNGGDYDYMVLGNYLYTNYSPSIYGTYSGNMTFNIGSGVTITHNIRNGANGQNYLTGTVTANIASWPEGVVIREYSWLGNAAESAEYDPRNNTGTVTVNLVGGLERTVAKAGDFDASGTVDIKDVLIMLDYLLDGMDENMTASYSPYYYGITDINLIDVLHALNKLTK
ncbi:MAG: hypothetical protein IJ002_07525 [Clostridia bacterium]|nr:hypothetical protein [Clostridia bacterium]